MKFMSRLVVILAVIGPILVHAKTVRLVGAAALAFYDRHGAELQWAGDKNVKGVFKSINKRGEERQGFAECRIQRSSEFGGDCTITY